MAGYARHMSDDGRRARKCGACNGEGGYYADPNGFGSDAARVEREWIPCPVPQCVGGMIGGQE